MMGADSMANPMMLGVLGGFGMAPFGMMGGEWPLSMQKARWQLVICAEPHSAVATALRWGEPTIAIFWCWPLQACLASAAAWRAGQGAAPQTGHTHPGTGLALTGGALCIVPAFWYEYMSCCELPNLPCHGWLPSSRCTAAPTLHPVPALSVCRGPGGFEGPRRGPYPDGPGPVRFGGPPDMPFGPRFDGPPGWRGSSGGFDGPPGPGRGFGGPPDWSRGRKYRTVGSARQFAVPQAWPDLQCIYIQNSPALLLACLGNLVLHVFALSARHTCCFPAGRPPSPRFHDRYRSRSPEWAPQHGSRCGWIALTLPGSCCLQRNG